MFEEYCALAEYVAEDSSQVSFTPGDKVLVMSKDKSGKSEKDHLSFCHVNICIGHATSSLPNPLITYKVHHCISV